MLLRQFQFSWDSLRVCAVPGPCLLNSLLPSPWASQVMLVVKNLPANAGDRRGLGSIWVGKILWRREWLPTPVFLSGESHGQRSLSVHRVAKSQTWMYLDVNDELSSHPWNKSLGDWGCLIFFLELLVIYQEGWWNPHMVGKGATKFTERRLPSAGAGPTLQRPSGNVKEISFDSSQS